MVESETRNKLTSSVPSTKRTLRWIGHSRSFKVILIGASRNPERRVVEICNLCWRYFWSLRRYGNGKTPNLSILTTPLKFEDVPARNAFEYLQMNYIARNYGRLLTYICAADSMVYIHWCSRNYASKSNPLNIKMLVPKPSFTWNSHSRSFYSHTFCDWSQANKG